VDSLGWAQFKLGRMAEAEATLRRATELSPYSPEIRRHLGEVLVKQGKLVEAAEQWERALAFIFPERAELEKRLGDLRVRIAKEQAQKLDGVSAKSPNPNADPSADPKAAIPAEDDEDDE